MLPGFRGASFTAARKASSDSSNRPSSWRVNIVQYDCESEIVSNYSSCMWNRESGCYIRSTTCAPVVSKCFSSTVT